MRYAICCDFDGTITLTDTGKALLNNLTDKNWQFYDELVINGEIGTREALRKQWGMLENVSKNKFYEIVNSIKIDPTFIEFYEWTKSEKIEFTILSDGFRSYISQILNNHHIKEDEIEIKANDMKLINGKIELNFLTEQCTHDCANCKYSHVKDIKDKGYSIIYIGDGLSDIFPANKLADYIFARKNEDLAKKLCEDSRLLTYSNFKEIRKEIEFILEKSI